MKTQQFEHDGFNSPNEVDQARRAKVQKDIRDFNTSAPLSSGITINPLKLQLIAHFDALTTEYAQRVAVDQLASLARLCAGCKKET